MFLKIHEQEYHRNGVTGQPFNVVEFTLYDEDVETVDLIAIIPEVEDGDDEEVFVINADDIGDKYRGDVIGERLLELLDNLENRD